jgi:hypothetical protein
MRAFIYVRTKSGVTTFPHSLELPITVSISTAELHSLLDITSNSLTPHAALLSHLVELLCPLQYVTGTMSLRRNKIS